MITARGFSQLSLRCRHKKAAAILRTIHESPINRIALYRNMESWLGLPALDEKDFRALSDRYHMHLTQAQISCKEHNLLYPLQTLDHPSTTPYLPIAIFLDQLRSAFNVGNILRTTEALRLGSVYFSTLTPFIDNPKVQKTSMQTFDKVPCYKDTAIESLPRPLIALETVYDAPSIFDFSFPACFTLMLGNEEYGLSQAALKQADAAVRIPLFGCKNSINVAAAFAIAAAVIRTQFPQR